MPHTLNVEMRSMKTFKFELVEDSSIFLDAELIYTIKETKHKEIIFCINNDHLKLYGIPLKKFKEFLVNKLDKTDPYFNSALELWSENLPVSSRAISDKDFDCSNRNSIYRVITSDEEIVLEKKIKNDYASSEQIY